ncbi:MULTISPECIES: LysR family transcriptional regulator [Pseudomonas]|uniref:LysR family transcriptional regulator n=1 Tax=Pseudomonas nitroreducens TaxID=46680 RepID=A0ABS0KIY4_PSENT|nr:MULTISPECIES: LysR family transcriptional regulator [Pseudomonas]MBG6288042.1 LysR family transcriptional regulator [Pseudomonas nitroreducens]MCJ1882816.1 LysR family transcriptional regulator [Pseudomonas nitroreducens]MCJ1898503.1 LysR family transcriptional regulator [Pseudomonas nitroreducens]MDG9856912.1 LysR family transcriptional regulator [Pseudomonas nitroreducens]MDH1075829.1 LysR family transcriptional regulator [Pseudomonas nitroreducens]
MDRLLSLEAFVRVAETGNFSKASQQLGVTRSVITHRIQQLEELIRAPLFHRSTRHVRLSEVGETYYKECAEMVASFHALTEQMQDMRTQPTGKLRMQMLPGFAIGHFGALLADFTHRYPDIEIDVVVNDRVVDPIEEGFDVAFQMFPPQAETLIERRLFRVRRLFCAAPGYLERHGMPEHPRDLLQHKIGLYEGYPSRNRWQFHGEDELMELSLHGQLRSNSVHLLRDYALDAGGVVCLPTLVSSDDLLAGRLVPVLTDYALSSFDFSAVYPATQRQALKVRTLVDFLLDGIGGEPVWDRPLFEKGWLKLAD